MSLDNTSHPGRPGPVRWRVDWLSDTRQSDELVPSRYALRVGGIDVVACVGAGARVSTEVTMEPVALKGNVYVSTYGQTKVHSYLSPPDGLTVNTQIVEGRSSVVIFDGQLHLPYAEEVASYIKMIGKPVDRFILSHGHSDHWSGLQVLTERFPAAAEALRCIRLVAGLDLTVAP